MTTENAELYQQAQSPPILLEGKVAGLAIPFNVSSRVSGLHFDDDSGKLTFFAYTIYMPGSLNVQLSSANPLDRTRFMWEHGLRGGRTSIPIGNVITMVASDDGVRFAAELNHTSVAEDMRRALEAASIRETSVKIESLVFDFPTDAEGQIFRRVTEAFIWDVSLVQNGQFPEARITEVFCEGCGTTVQSSSSRREPHDDESAVGALFARINDLQEELRLQSAVSARDMVER